MTAETNLYLISLLSYICSLYKDPEARRISTLLQLPLSKNNIPGLAFHNITYN
jgi:hypothetical protein